MCVAEYRLSCCSLTVHSIQAAAIKRDKEEEEEEEEK